MLALREAVATACRQAEAEYTSRGTVVYEVKIENPYTAPVDGLVLDFAPAADSMRVVADGGVDTIVHAPSVRMPAVPVRGRVRVRAWARQADDSAIAVLRGPDAREELRAEVHNPVRTAPGRGRLTIRTSALPPATQLPGDGAVDVTLVGTGAVRGNAWALPEGWPADAATLRDSSGAPVPGSVTTGRRGVPALVWSSRDGQVEPVTVTLHPASGNAPDV